MIAVATAIDVVSNFKLVIAMGSQTIILKSTMYVAKYLCRIWKYRECFLQMYAEFKHLTHPKIRGRSVERFGRQGAPKSSKKSK
jgi:hypothetical protein